MIPVSGASLLTLIAVLLIIAWGMVLWTFRRTLARLWREPVLRVPIFIVESDDWGPGSEEHAAALSRICEVLVRHRDSIGRPAVMTIGVVLAVPDIAEIERNGHREYARKTLRHPDFSSMRDGLIRGRECGVLALQLHGLEHLWPPAFMRAASTAGSEVRGWLAAGNELATEALPSVIQSRWTEGSTLPSVALTEAEIDSAVVEEVLEFEQALGEVPKVVVPPTFVWNESVERAWSANGLQVLITPGRRNVGRDQQGKPGPVDRDYLNGDVSSAGLICLVRDIYFEPALDHAPEAAVARVLEHFRLGRPALLETHRFNFTDEPTARERSLAALDELLGQVRHRLPAVRFMSSFELATALQRGDPGVTDGRFSRRLEACLLRLRTVSRLRKLAILSGLAILYWLALVALSRLGSSRVYERRN